VLRKKIPSKSTVWLTLHAKFSQPVSPVFQIFIIWAKMFPNFVVQPLRSVPPRVGLKPSELVPTTRVQILPPWYGHFGYIPSDRTCIHWSLHGGSFIVTLPAYGPRDRMQHNRSGTSPASWFWVHSARATWLFFWKPSCGANVNHIFWIFRVYIVLYGGILYVNQLKLWKIFSCIHVHSIFTVRYFDLIILKFLHLCK